MGGVVDGAERGAFFVATKKELTKEQKIKKEIARLKRVFKDLDKNKLQTVESLIKNAAFMAVSLEELQEIINAEGYAEPDPEQHSANRNVGSRAFQ